jgi:hypothetical protein
MIMDIGWKSLEKKYQHITTKDSDACLSADRVRSTKSEFRVERTVTMGNDMILVWD